MNDPFAKRRAKQLALKAIRDSQSLPITDNMTAAPCPQCGEAVDRGALSRSFYVCPMCGYHYRIGAYYRLSLVLDAGSFREVGDRVAAGDPLRFPEYAAKLENAQRRTGLSEAIVTAVGAIEGRRVAVGVLDTRFLMGSMSASVGERLTQLVELAGRYRIPLVLFSASGGARMQEGILSLMQMAKTAAALEAFSQKGGLYVSTLTDPTTGGVTASFASLGDIILAEPGALIGFTGPRVIEQTIHQRLPEGFQRAEFMQAHGFVDQVVPRAQLRETLARVLRLHGRGRER